MRGAPCVRVVIIESDFMLIYKAYCLVMISTVWQVDWRGCAYIVAISNICFNGEAKVLTGSGYKLIRELTLSHCMREPDS